MKNKNILSIQKNYLSKFDRIILFSLCIAFSLVMITIHFNLRSYKKRELQTISESMITIANNQTNHFDSLLQSKMDFLRYLTQYPDIYEMNWNDQRAFLSDKTKQMGFFHTFVMDMRGFGYYVSTDEIKNQSKEQFYFDLLTHDDFITQPFYGDDATTITLCTSIYRNSRKVGVLCGTINLTDLCASFSEYSMILGGEMFLLNERGSYIANTNSQNLKADYSIYKDPSINSALFHEVFASQSSKSGQIVINGISYEAYLKYLPDYNWVLAVCIPNKNSVQSFNSLNTLQLFADILSIFGVFGVLHIIINWRLSYHKSLTDQLTKAPNRAALSILFEHLDNLTRYNVAILYMDLNNFKQMNDTYGHEFGDQLLCAFYKVLSNTYGKDGFVCRMGGDEFVCVLLEQTEQKIIETWKEICSQLEKESDALGLSTPITSSIGYSFRQKGEDIRLELVMDQADKKMYLNKHRN